MIKGIVNLIWFPLWVVVKGTIIWFDSHLWVMVKGTIIWFDSHLWVMVKGTVIWFDSHLWVMVKGTAIWFDSHLWVMVKGTIIYMILAIRPVSELYHASCDFVTLNWFAGQEWITVVFIFLDMILFPTKMTSFMGKQGFVSTHFAGIVFNVLMFAVV